jgi:hypothetical protein
MRELIEEYMKEEKKEPNCHDRYLFRQVERWGEVEWGILLHRFWWLVHNCVAHPLIGVCPIKTFHDFHDWTSIKLNNR